MKISLERNQVISLIGLAIFVLAAIGLGWFGLGGLFEESDQAQQLEERRGKSEIAAILGRPGGVNEVKKEIKQLDDLSQTLAKQEAALIDPWRKSTQEALGEGKDWAKDGNKWKDLLVKYNDEILKRSGKNEDKKKVTLAPNFYLGLEEFKQKSPKDDQVPALARQLAVSKRLIDLLFLAKESVREGYPTPCILVKLQGPAGADGQPTENTKAKGKPGEKSDLLRESYLIEFECSPEVLYSYIANLTKDSWFFIPTNLHLENERDSFPLRSELAGSFKAPTTAESSPGEQVRGGTNSVAPPLLLILAGKEKVRVELQVDYLGWRSTAPEKESGKGKP